MSYNTLINHDKKFILFWNPKVACSYLKRWYLSSIGICTINQGGPKKYDIFSKDFDEHLFVEKHKIMFSVKKESLNLYGGYKKVLVIRDPVDRLVSFYRDKIIMNRWSTWDSRWNSDYFYLKGDRSEKIPLSDITFESLTNMILDVNDANINDHLRSQSFKIEDISFDYIFNINTTRNIGMSLNNIFDLNIKNIIFNQTKQHSSSYIKKSYDNGHKRKVSWFKEKNMLPHTLDLCTKKIEDVIFCRYKDDFLKFSDHLIVSDNIKNKIKEKTGE